MNTKQRIHGEPNSRKKLTKVASLLPQTDPSTFSVSSSIPRPCGGCLHKGNAHTTAVCPRLENRSLHIPAITKRFKEKLKKDTRAGSNATDTARSWRRFITIRHKQLSYLFRRKQKYTELLITGIETETDYTPTAAA